jgi:uncharacterized damage-inducible protein DinB
VNLPEVRSLFAYNEWANQRVFDTVGPLSEEQFARALSGSFSSIRDTLGHVVGVEWVWLRRWNGESPRSTPDWAKTPTVASLQAKLGEVEREREAFLASLSERDLDRGITYTNFAGEQWTYPLRDLLVHLVNHSTYHRGQIATMLRQVGAKAVATDYLVFKDQTRRVAR